MTIIVGNSPLYPIIAPWFLSNIQAYMRTNQFTPVRQHIPLVNLSSAFHPPAMANIHLDTFFAGTGHRAVDVKISIRLLPICAGLSLKNADNCLQIQQIQSVSINTHPNLFGSGYRIGSKNFPALSDAVIQNEKSLGFKVKAVK